jgi:hypothetical protein
MNKSDLAPWARGPFELIKHADGHLKEASDTDRRIAIIGFDNAIEVCIDVFIKLHPKLRGGVELRQDEVEKAIRNYHTKIEWLDKYVEANNLEIEFSIEEIVWYHSLRNELYHSGNGMVPEMHVLEGARSAALAVFNTLFKADINSILGVESPKLTKPSERILFAAQNDEMELLRLFIEFERALETSLKTISHQSELRPRSVKQMWDEYKSLVKTPPEWDLAVQEVLPIRNNIAHGKSDKVNSDDVVKAYLQLMEVTEALTASVKITEKLKANKNSIKNGG